MSYKVLVIHGSFATPYINWFPWLHNELVEKNISCLIPAMPFGDDQNYDNWKSVMDSYLPFLDGDLIVIGHSIGPAFLLNYFADTELNVSKLISVSGFFDVKTPSQEYNQANSSFFKRPLEDLIISNSFKKIPEVISFYSTNDPYLSDGDLKSFAKSLGGKTIVSESSGHFNWESGYTQFEELLKII